MTAANQQPNRDLSCACSCGATSFQTTAKPLFRILCHCTICQRFNDEPFADVVVFHSSDVEKPASGLVNFDTYKPPPNVQRGKCASCNKPAIELFHTALFPKLVMVPRRMFAADAELPEPKAHLFYDKRLADADDGYPKHKGMLRSQFAFLKHLRSSKRS